MLEAARKHNHIIFSAPCSSFSRCKYSLRKHYLFLVLALSCDMKVLLKQSGTNLFLKDSDRWTKSFTDALDFKTTPAAMDYSRIHGFRGAIIILKFANACDDFELRNCC